MSGATEIIRELYERFPEVEFIDERGFGDVVELYFTFKRMPEKLSDFLAYNLYVEYYLSDRLLIIRADEEDDEND